MPAAEIIAIGTELLLGEIQDTNTRYLARLLRDDGVDIYRTSIVGDNADRIAQVISESLQRCQIIITTGGLGPTVDDPTRQAVAQAVGVNLEFRPDLWDQIQERFKRYNRPPTENNRRQAYIPAGAIPVENPVGTAPAFIIENATQSIISLPGVPREMEYLTQNTVLPYLRQRFGLKGTIKACVLHVAGVGESQVDEWIGDLELLPNPTVGLLAHPGQVDVRITAKAASAEEADQMIARVAAEIEKRVGDNLYGRDKDTLEGVIAQKLAEKGWQLSLFEYGLGEVFHRLGQCNPAAEELLLPDPPGLADLHQKIAADQQSANTVYFVIVFLPHETRQTLHMVLLTPGGELETTRNYGGPPGNGPFWAVNTSLDFLRRTL